MGLCEGWAWHADCFLPVPAIRHRTYENFHRGAAYSHTDCWLLSLPVASVYLEKVAITAWSEAEDWFLGVQVGLSPLLTPVQRFCFFCIASFDCDVCTRQDVWTRQYVALAST
jgi:hypothetical protein